LLHIIQKYMYIHDENQDMITVYFVENNNIPGSRFHTIIFQPSKSSKILQSEWTPIDEYQYEQDHHFIAYLFAYIYLVLK